MKIAIFTNNYLPNPYGVTTSIESFRKEFEKRGHTVYIFAPKNSDFKDKNKNVFRYPSIDLKYKIRFPLPIPYSREIERKIEKLDFDIIHSQHPNLLGKLASKWAKKKKIPLVFTWHTLYDRYTHYTPLIPKKISNSWVIKNAVNYANKADKIIIPTTSIEKIIRDWGVINNQIVAIPTGVDEESFLNSNKEKIKKDFVLDENKKIILSISRLTEEKNVVFLVKEVIKVLKKYPNTLFILGGDGYLKDYLIRLINEARVGEQVFLAGLIKRELMKDYFSLADIFVYASKSETQGTIITEAMYMGLPIVALRALGISDLIENNKTGILTSEYHNDFSKEVGNLVKDDDRAKIIGQLAKKKAQESYTSKVCATKMLAIYKELCEKNKG